MNKSDLALIPELFAENYVHRAAAGPETRGHDGWRQNVANAHAAFPDLHYSIESVVCEGDKVVCNGTFSGTNAGALQGMPPTGKKMAVKHTYIATVRDGRSVETWSLVDRLSLLQQLGLMPAAPTT